ncbi:MAG: ferric reductase-like transmembrane domain-containing protein [Thermoleophilia bacterium]|nr:ferric reductase-like transmembrane domain-containing protein [Thermoleophilia bacterium]
MPHPRAVDLLAGLAGLGLGATVAFDLLAESTTTLSAPGGMMTAAGRLTGMIGTYMLLMVVLLVGRIPALERVIGQDKLIAWHRKLGPYSLVLLTAHGVLITLGYAQAARNGFLRQIGTLTTSYPGMLTAIVALIALIAAGVTSYRIARRRMKYETWWIVHLYTYLAVALSYSHQLATGTPFIGHPIARTFWIGLYLLTLGVVLSFRVALPVWRSMRHQLRVVAIHAEAPGVISIVCRGRKLNRLPVAGGQFMQWRFLSAGEWWQAHPYSLSALPTETLMRVTIKDLGDQSGGLPHIKLGTRVAIEGPYGALTHHARVARHVLLVGAGVGVTPLRAMLEDLPADVSADMIVRASSAEDLVLRGELATLIARRGGHMHELVGSRRHIPLDAQQVHQLVPDIAQRDVFVCGPEGFMQGFLNSARQLGVPEQQLHHEDYAF